MQQQTQRNEQKPQQFSCKAAPKTPSAYFEYESALEMQRTIGNHGLLRQYGVPIQPKLKIGEPNDEYEQQADRVADVVMRVPELALQRRTENEAEPNQAKFGGAPITPLIQRQTEEGESEEVEVEEERIQPKTLPGRTSNITSNITAQINTIRGYGQPLSGSVRAFFEPRFGYDFGQVRIHSDTAANKLAKAVNARAFTIGRHVVFGAGQYGPGTTKGWKLLAHELTHVVQQNTSAESHRRNRIIPSSFHWRGEKNERIQRQPAAVEPTRTKPRPIKITIDPSDTIVFQTSTSILGDVTVYVTGRMAVVGNASLIGEELPNKGAAAALKSRVRELVKDALTVAKLTGTAANIEVPLVGGTLELGLADDTKGSPAFNVSGHFNVKWLVLRLPGCEISKAGITLDATVWIAPSKSSSTTGSKEMESAPVSPSDASVTRFTFASSNARFQYPKPKSKDPERSGGVTLKGAMEAFETRVWPVIQENPYARKFLLLTEQRAAFFQQMRAYFKTDENTIEHFAKLRKANVKGAATWLHEEAAKRLEAVQAEIKLENMPSSGGVGWPRSECRLSNEQSTRNLHNIGFAIDYNAYQAPHLEDPRILDLIRIVTGRSATTSKSPFKEKEARDIGATFTFGTGEEKEKLEVDPKIQKWIDQIGREAEAVSKASEDFRASLKSTEASGAEVNLAPKLQELRQKWFEAKTDADKKAVLSKLPGVLMPWLDKVAAEKIKMEKKITSETVDMEKKMRAAGLDPEKLPTGKKLQVKIGEARQLAKRIRQLRDRLGTELKKGQRKEVDKLTIKAREFLNETGEVPANDAAAIKELRRLVDLIEKQHDALALQQESQRKLSDQKGSLDQVNALQAALTGDPTFVFGKSLAKTAVSPPLAQIVDIGFFTLRGKPKAGAGAFGADFVTSMVKRGFTHGATWSKPDLMHFELRWKGPGQKG